MSVGTATAGGLAPSKASQLITVASSTSACNISGTFKVNTQQNPDGTTTPFSVPAGLVFVVTSYDWFLASSGSPGATVLLQLTVEAATSFSLVSAQIQKTDANGFAGGNVQLPPGFVVKSGANLCAATLGVSPAVVVHGFLAKDK